MSFREPVVLTGRQWVTLEPLSGEHVEEIAAVASDGTAFSQGSAAQNAAAAIAATNSE